MKNKNRAVKIFTLKFRAANRDIFDAIKDGSKSVETRAATQRYRDIKTGDIVKLSCGGESFQKKLNAQKYFRQLKR